LLRPSRPHHGSRDRDGTPGRIPVWRMSTRGWWPERTPAPEAPHSVSKIGLTSRWSQRRRARRASSRSVTQRSSLLLKTTAKCSGVDGVGRPCRSAQQPVCRLRAGAPTLQPSGSSRLVRGTSRAERSGFGNAKALQLTRMLEERAVELVALGRSLMEVYRADKRRSCVDGG
jgi:hypothetical protein